MKRRQPMNIALLQFNPVVGDLESNTQTLIEWAQAAKARGASLAIAPELCLCGYPPKDLLDREAFVRDLLAATARVVSECPDMPLVFGSVSTRDGRLYNAAIAACDGALVGCATKQLLPTYDVFDERRHFTPGSSLQRLQLGNLNCAVSICEDAWGDTEDSKRRYGLDPLAGLPGAGADLLINLSASPFTLDKYSFRSELFSSVARRIRLPVAMVNQVGANDELIFDGHSGVWNEHGELVARAKSFDEDLLIAQLSATSTPETQPVNEELAYRALVLGLRDYARKCGFTKAVLGLSGGIDSALVATLAADALGSENVLGVGMPSRYSSAHSIADAKQLAQNLGIGFELISIEPLFATFLETLQEPIDRLRAPYSGDVTWENVQARLRGATVMAVSNRTGAIALTTGNKSEVAVGYCTLYGDMVGGLSVISDVPKTLVYSICHWINRNGERIPDNSLTKPPSAELRPDQKDEDSLPPYSILDPILESCVEDGLNVDEIVGRGFDRDTVLRVVKLVRGAEYKRRQAAPGLIITSKAFGPGRRMPVAQKYRFGT
jgi:NAD+ synthase (glutamine-hydrolysing)